MLNQDRSAVIGPQVPYQRMSQGDYQAVQNLQRQESTPQRRWDMRRRCEGVQDRPVVGIVADRCIRLEHNSVRLKTGVG